MTVEEFNFAILAIDHCKTEAVIWLGHPTWSSADLDITPILSIYLIYFCQLPSKLNERNSTKTCRWSKGPDPPAVGRMTYEISANPLSFGGLEIRGPSCEKWNVIKK